MTRVAIAGAIAVYPFGGGGNSWAFLQYVLGLMRLGCEVLYVEEFATDDSQQPTSDFAGSVKARYFAELIEQHRLAGHASLLDARGAGHVGLAREEVASWCDGADLFINISGH